MLKINRIGVIALLMMVVATPCLAKTIEEVEKDLVAAMKKTKSIKGDMKTEFKVANQGFEMKSTTVGVVESLREGELYMARSEGTTDSMQKMAGTETKKQQKTLSISDGKFSYTLTESDGVKQATKSKAVEGDRLPWKDYGKDAKFKVLPDEKVDGADCYVIEMNMAAGMPGAGMGKMVFYCRKDCGMQAKMVGFGPDGTEMMNMTIKNIVLNKGVSADRFVFKAPEGVTVTDATGA